MMRYPLVVVVPFCTCLFLCLVAFMANSSSAFHNHHHHNQLPPKALLFIPPQSNKKYPVAGGRSTAAAPTFISKSPLSPSTFQMADKEDEDFFDNNNDDDDKSTNMDNYEAWLEKLDPSTFEESPDEIQERETRVNRGRGGNSGRGGFADNDNYDGDNQRAPRRSNNQYGRGHDYERDYEADQSNVDENAVNALLSERLQARKQRNYDLADDIRNQLLQEHGVRVHDQMRVWRTGASARGSGNKWSYDNRGYQNDNYNDRRGGRGGGRYNDRGGRGGYNDRGGGRGGYGNDRRGSRNPQQQQDRDFGPNGHDYSYDPSAGPSESSLSEQEINVLLAQRLNFKLGRQFRAADQVQAQLEEYGVQVHDGFKLWRADGQSFETSRGGDRGTGPYQMSPFSLPLIDPNEAVADPDMAQETADMLKGRIEQLIQDRQAARQDRNFREADAIREELAEDYNVIINDRRRMWSVGGKFDDDRYDESRTSSRSGDNKQRFDAPLVYEMSPYSLPWEALLPQDDNLKEEEGGNDALVEEVKAKVMNLVEERSKARFEGDYRVADAIQRELLDSYRTATLDRMGQFSIGGVFHPPPAAYSMESFSDEPTTIAIDEVDELAAQRDQLRKERRYEEADEIKESLLKDHRIRIDDDERHWYVLGSRSSATDEDVDDTSSSGGSGASLYVRRGGGSIEPDELAIIEQMIEERYVCRSKKEFGKADRIRERLANEFNVRTDDKNMEWHLVTNEYRQTGGNQGLDEETVAMIEDQIQQRAQAKLQADYDTADNIRFALMDNFGVNIDDRTKEWEIVPRLESDQDYIDETEAMNNPNTVAVDDAMVSNETEESDSDESVPFFASGAASAAVEDASSAKEEAATYSVESLEELTVVQLKDLLREKGLPVSGRKAELIERLSA